MAAPKGVHGLTTSAPAMATYEWTSDIGAGPDDIDSPDENDLDADQDGDEDDSTTYTVDAASLIGVSISRAQAEMLSPVIPAALKVQVLEHSKNYFEMDADDQVSLFDEPLQDQASSYDGTSETQADLKQHDNDTAITVEPPVSKITDRDGKADQRSSLVSSILGSATSVTRQRSSSGSSIVEGIRKRLPGWPSFFVTRSPGPNEAEKRVLGPACAGAAIPAARTTAGRHVEQSRTEHPRGSTITNRASQPIYAKDDMGSRINKTNMTTSPSPPQVLRRSISDHSLYIRRAATGASDFDDYTAWSNVSEMVNSRFKAISDSWQDSALRHPKLPSIAHSGHPRLDEHDNNNDRNNLGQYLGSKQASSMQQTKQISRPADIHTSKHPQLKTALNRLTGDLVIMGGYRGSILREAQTPNRQLWVPIKVGMNLRKADLEVGLTREDELRMEESIIADGALSHIGPVDICRRLIRKCRKCPNVQDKKLRFHDYGWDWRLSPDLMSDRLICFLESLPCNRQDLPHSERGAWVIAHSLGGILTRHVINRRPELVKGVLYAGTPQNCVNILGPLRNGDDVLFSSRVLTAQVNFTLRTSYALLPQNGRCFINKLTGERYDVDFFNVKTWEEYRLSPCIRAPLRRHKPEKKQSFMGSISEAMSPSSKVSSWFALATSNKNTMSEQGNSLDTVSPQIEEGAHGAKEDFADVVKAAEPERLFSPTMAEGSSQAAKHKPSIATTSTLPLAAATEYLSTTLSSVLAFKQELSHIPELQSRNAYPPASILFAKNTPTVYGAFVASREAIKYDDAFDDLAFAAGDGVVLASAAQPPLGYRCVRNGRIESDRGHVGLLGDLEGVGKCLNALIDAREQGVGHGAHECLEVENRTTQSRS